jgi:hypothetical protein
MGGNIVTCDFVDGFRQIRTHRMALEIAEELHDRPTLKVPARERPQPRADAAPGGPDDVVGLVLGQVERDRISRIDADGHRVLPRWERGAIAVGRVLAGLAENGPVERERGHVAGCAPDLVEDRKASENGDDLDSRQRRLEQAQRLELDERCRPRLGGQVDRERRLVADRELVGHVVEIAVDAVADNLDRLHAELVVGGAPVEVS